MRTTIIFLACVISQVVAVQRWKDKRYCLSEICGYGNNACMNNGSFIYCNLKGPKLVNMAAYREGIAEQLNNLRSDVAGGKYRNLPKAARMSRMSWSDELAWFAHLEVVVCRKAEDHCHSSPYFYYIGVLTEEVFRNYIEESVSNLAVIRDVISYWTRGIPFIEKKHTLRLPTSFKMASSYRASLIINERNSHFGCAMVFFKKNDHFILSCAFATANIVGRPIYQWGLKPGIKCHKRDRKYKNLCADGEKYDNHKRTPSAEVMSEEMSK